MTPAAPPVAACPSIRQLAPFAGYYFFYFAFVGVLSPYWGLYLQSLDFSPWQISVLTALSMAARVAAPASCGWLADRRGERRGLIRGLSLLAMLAFAGTLFTHDFWLLFGVLSCAFFFWAGTLPLVEASTLDLTAATPGRYSRVRLWGSIGFVVLTLAVGGWLKVASLASLPAILCATLLAAFLCALTLPLAPIHRVSPALPTAPAAVSRGAVGVIFAVSFLMLAAHGPYYTFYSIGLRQHGYSADAIGGMWAVGVLCEVAVFWAMPSLARRVSLPQLLRFSLLMAVLRFGLMAAFPQALGVMVFAQTLHAFTFATFHTASVGLVHRYFPAHLQSRGQGLYIVFSYGAGGTVGSLLAGTVWAQGGMAAVFWPAAGAAAVAWLLAWWGIAPLARQ